MKGDNDDLVASAMADVEEEIQRQNRKWGPNQNHSPQEWISILTEEVGEAANEANNASVAPDLGPGFVYSKSNCLSRLRTELVQVAAVAVQMAARL